MTFSDDARARAREVAVSWDPKTVVDTLVEMAEWARDHLAAQEPTRDEIEEALRAYHQSTGFTLGDRMRDALLAARRAER